MKVTVFEFDKRFGRYGDAFVDYDHKEPLKNVQEKFAAQCFDVVVADPPFLSQECFQLTRQTVRYLSKDKMVVRLDGGLHGCHPGRTCQIEPQS